MTVTPDKRTSDTQNLIGALCEEGMLYLVMDKGAGQKRVISAKIDRLDLSDTMLFDLLMKDVANNLYKSLYGEDLYIKMLEERKK